LNAEQSASGRQSRPRWSECERPQQAAPNVQGTGPEFHTGPPAQKARRLLIAKQSAAARGVDNIKVGFIDKDELSEKLELVKVEKLDAKEMAEVRDAAWKLEASAAERLPDVFGKAKPSERQFGKLIAENAKEIAPQEVKEKVTMW